MYTLSALFYYLASFIFKMMIYWHYFLAICSSSVCCSSSLVSWARRVRDASTSWMVRRLLADGGNDLLSSKNILTVSDTSPLRQKQKQKETHCTEHLAFLHHFQVTMLNDYNWLRMKIPWWMCFHYINETADERAFSYKLKKIKICGILLNIHKAYEFMYKVLFI